MEKKNAEDNHSYIALLVNFTYSLSFKKNQIKKKKEHKTINDKKKGMEKSSRNFVYNSTSTYSLNILDYHIPPVHLKEIPCSEKPLTILDLCHFSEIRAHRIDFHSALAYSIT